MDFAYKVKYSARRTLGISITRDGDIVVRAPYRTPETDIRRMLTEHEDWILRHISSVRARRAAHPEPTSAEEATLRAEARRYLPDKVAHYAAQMGVTYGRITITGARTRFGSCSSRGNLSFSFRLMQYPEAAREYVVVHELAHRRQMNHSPAFYREVAAVLPDYKERARLLKK